MTLTRSLRTGLGRPSIVLFACMFASQAGLLVLSPILPDLARDLGVSTATAGQLRTLSGTTGGITAVLLAILPRRPRLRTLLSAGAALMTIGSVLSAAAPGFAVLAVAQGVIGVGIGVLVAVAIAAAGEWTAPSDRPRTLAWAIAGMPTAWVVGCRSPEPRRRSTGASPGSPCPRPRPRRPRARAPRPARPARPDAQRPRRMAPPPRRPVHGRRAARQRRLGRRPDLRRRAAHRGLRRAARHRLRRARDRRPPRWCPGPSSAAAACGAPASRCSAP